MAADEAKAEEKSKGSSMKLIIIILLVLLLAAGGFVGYIMFIKKDTGGDMQEGRVEQQKTRTTKPKILMPIESFIVNLLDKTGVGRRYLKITLQLEVGSNEQVMQLVSFKTQMRDAVLMLLSTLTFADINSMEGKLELKQELLHRLNQVVGSKYINQIYFTEFVVQ